MSETNSMAVVEGLIGHKVRIETREGAVLVGVLTNVNYNDVKVILPNYKTPIEVKTPISINFNHDPGEAFDWAIIAKITKA